MSPPPPDPKLKARLSHEHGVVNIFVTKHLIICVFVKTTNKLCFKVYYEPKIISFDFLATNTPTLMNAVADVIPAFWMLLYLVINMFRLNMILDSITWIKSFHLGCAAFLKYLCCIFIGWCTTICQYIGFFSDIDIGAIKNGKLCIMENLKRHSGGWFWIMHERSIWRGTRVGDSEKYYTKRQAFWTYDKNSPLRNVKNGAGSVRCYRYILLSDVQWWTQFSRYNSKAHTEYKSPSVSMYYLIYLLFWFLQKGDQMQRWPSRCAPLINHELLCPAWRDIVTT